MSNSKQHFYPQLDSLRAIAVLLVIISHWFSNKHFLNRYISNGVLGVTLFFVLSGFLITDILLKSKKNVEIGCPRIQAFKVFYIRRSLRIFPVYYLLLFFSLIFDFASVRDSFWWHFFYSSNFYFWFKDAFTGSLSHLWSLAVEEQFYLIWPAFILLIPTRYFVQVLIAGVIIGTIFRFLFVNTESDMARILMPGSLDSFCIGGLLAYGRIAEINWYRTYLKKQKIFVFFAFFTITMVHLPFFKILPAGLNSSLYFLLISVAFGILINRVAFTVHTPLLKQILNNRILLYIGKISYSLYLFHNFVPYFYRLTIPGVTAALSPYIIQFLRFVLLVAGASFSWFVIEKPLLKLKKHFAYV